MLAVTPTLRGQYIFAPSGARSAGMGDCGVALYDLHSATLNIAAAARIGEPQIALAYRQDFMLSELAYKSITGSYTFRRHRASGGSTSAIPYGTLLAHYTHYGNSNYQEQHASLGYALGVSRMISIGIGLDYLHSGASLAGYTHNMVTCSIGLQFYPTSELTIGASVFNPLFVKANTSLVTTRVPVDFRIGVSYRILKPLLATIEVEKNIYEASSLHCGLEYTYHDWLFARVGMATGPMHLSLGIGVLRPHFGIDLALRYHTILGLTPQATLLYRF